MLNIEEIATKWEGDKEHYENLGRTVTQYIKGGITESEILPEISYRVKDLLSIIKKIRKKQVEKDYSYDELSDRLGIRIVCSLQEEMETVDDFIKSNFQVVKTQYKHLELDFDKLAYVSNHYDLRIDPNRSDFNKCKDWIFEVQVRTINQHAWSSCSHKIVYKNAVDLNPKLKRRIYRLLSLYEIADDEFSMVNSEIRKMPEDLVFPMLNILEGKLFKLAGIDYDRELAISNLRVILGYFSISEKGEIFNNINTYIELNSVKISKIFRENQFRYHMIPLLTQPEIFLIWFGLEKYPFSITDNWNNDFLSTELGQIANLYGISVD